MDISKAMDGVNIFPKVYMRMAVCQCGYNEAPYRLLQVLTIMLGLDSVVNNLYI